MSILGKIFSSGAKDLVDSVGNAIDKIHTSAEEKELIKAEIKQKILDYDYNIQKEVTKRWEADACSYCIYSR
jgi:RNA-binding protein YhbY